jgi:hypothetical protein
MSESLPTESDFLEDHGCLDAQCAWKNFGGLTLDQAYERFCDNPLHYQEDFMFMGEPAFTFYFPVLDRYVREGIRDRDEDRFEYLSILRDVIWFHFAQSFDEEVVQERVRRRDLADEGRLRSQVVNLCEYILREVPSLYLGSRPCSQVSEEGVTLVWRGLLSLAKSD